MLSWLKRFLRLEKPVLYKNIVAGPLDGPLKGRYMVERLDGGYSYAYPPITVTLED